MKLKFVCFLGALSLLVAPAIADDDVEYQEFIEIEDLYEDDDIDDAYDEEYMTEEVRGVSERLTCADINERIANLREDVKSYPEFQDELNAMTARWRSQCAPVASRRPVRNYLNARSAAGAEMPPVEEVLEPEATEVEEPVVEPEPEKTPEEIEAELAAAAEVAAENLAKGLCADGAKPNRYGCCAGYKFKEVSQMKFACCADDDCMEPIVKK